MYQHIIQPKSEPCHMTQVHEQGPPVTGGNVAYFNKSAKLKKVEFFLQKWLPFFKLEVAEQN
jgi:hypothetical protein